MKKYHLFHALGLSFYSADFYRDVGQRGSGLGFCYLWALLALSCLPLTYKLYQALTHMEKDFVHAIPDFSYKNGSLSLDQAGPWVFTYPSSGEQLVIDPHHSPSPVTLDSNALVLITDKDLYYRARSDFELHQLPLAAVPGSFDKQALITNLHRITAFLPCLIYVGLWTLSFLYRSGEALTYGLIAFLWLRMLRIKTPFSRLVRLSSAALTPAIVLMTLVSWFDFPISSFLLFSFVLTLGYILFAFWVNKQSPLAPPEKGLPLNTQ